MATFKIIRILFMLLLVNYSSGDGSHIALNVSSPSIQPLLTSSFNLRCSLRDTASSGATIIGRSIASTPNNAKFVLSIFVFQNDKDIATVSEHVPAKSLLPQTNLDVSGAIPGSLDGETGFINLQWRYPTTDQGGNYSCHVTAIDDVGHQMTYVTSVDVDVVSPRMDDLVKHIHAQDLRADQMTSHMPDQDRLIEQLRAENASNKAEIKTLQEKDNAIEAELAVMKHIEHGVVNCGDVGGCCSPLSRTKSVSFKKAYGSTPFVFIAVKDMNTHKDWHAYYKVRLTAQDASGFSITCSVDNKDHYAGDLNVSWLSLPQ